MWFELCWVRALGFGWGLIVNGTEVWFGVGLSIVDDEARLGCAVSERECLK